MFFYFTLPLKELQEKMLKNEPKLTHLDNCGRHLVRECEEQVSKSVEATLEDVKQKYVKMFSWF